MGFVTKSAIGLGCVYFAMFSQSLKSEDLASTTNPCASAAKAVVTRDKALRAQWAAAGCAVEIRADAQQAAAAAAPPPPPQPRISPPRASGTLTEADMLEPWFGPGRILRKSDRRG
jgi:hypothetical protein